jgi:LCP family protein required for cell wall assembly
VDLPGEVVNVILLGSDQRPNGAGHRTDTILMVSLDPEGGQATLLSIPRDLYVYLPGWRMDRINTAEPRGGFPMLADTFRYNFGLELDHWVLVRFWDLEAAIDLLGGIQVTATGHLEDECGGTIYRYEPGGIYDMDGFTALCYVRMRKRSSDFDRLRRQQEVVLAMFRKVISVEGLERVPELFEAFRHTFETDMTLEEVLALVPLASKLALEPERTRLYRITPTLVQGWRVPGSGAAVLLPKAEAVHDLLQRAFGPDE